MFHTVISRTVRFPETTVAGSRSPRGRPLRRAPPRTATSPRRCSHCDPTPRSPGRLELFRRTDAAPAVPEVTELPSLSTTTSSPALRGSAAARRPEPTPEQQPPLDAVPGGRSRRGRRRRPGRVPQRPRRRDAAARRHPGPPRPPAHRTRHDEKITVYISADELLELETARLTLRGAARVAADRGRIVREAISVVLADLAERGEDSVLVRRLGEVSPARLGSAPVSGSTGAASTPPS